MQLVNASLVPGHKLRVDKLTASPRQYQGALPGHALELSKGQGGGVQIGVVDPKGELSDVIAEARPAPPLRSCSRGALFLSDDLVVPPALRARVLQALNGEGGCPDDLGSDDEGPDGTEDATVLATSAELEAPSTTASVPVSARVRATATDEDGNVTPLDTDVTLDVQAGLEEIGLAKSTDVTVRGLPPFVVSAHTIHRRSSSRMLDRTRSAPRSQVEVPVTVQVNVDGGPCDTEGADVAVPVDVDVSVDILVDGQRIGTGNGGVVFVRCREGAVARWGQCGGIVYSRRGAPKRFAAACAEGACVRKNRWFAMCVPDDTQRVFKGQGWDGKVLVCR